MADYLIGSGITARGITLNPGDTETVTSAGTSILTTINSASLETISAGGLDIRSFIGEGGFQVISAGGVARATLIHGEQDVGGTAGPAVVFNGGIQSVEAGGQAVATIVLGGGTEVVSGVAKGTIVNVGGSEYVGAGGTALAPLIRGGTLEIDAGASVGAAPVVFAGIAGGTLLLDDSVDFGGLVAGFGKSDQLDLRDLGFVSSGMTVTFTPASHFSGTLTVSNGAQTAEITLLGQYATGAFVVASDGQGGTLVTVSSNCPHHDDHPGGFLAQRG